MKMLFARSVAVALVLFLTATGLWGAAAEEEPAAAAEKEMVLDPTTGEMVEAPRYGGTLTYAVRMTRTMTLEVLRQDFIRTAWSKGPKSGS